MVGGRVRSDGELGDGGDELRLEGNLGGVCELGDEGCGDGVEVGGGLVEV